MKKLKIGLDFDGVIVNIGKLKTEEGLTLLCFAIIYRNHLWKIA